MGQAGRGPSVIICPGAHDAIQGSDADTIKGTQVLEVVSSRFPVYAVHSIELQHTCRLMKITLVLERFVVR